MAELFVRRPILAIVISILIVLVGAISLTGLPVEEYPDVTPPQIQVSAVYPGASAQVIEETVATPLELEINGVDGLLYMQSTAANDGTLNISVYFRTGTDLDNANMLVQNRVAQAQSKLPQDVVRQGITVKKAQTNILMLVALSSPKGTYDQTFLANYANINVKDQLLRIPGIGRVDLMGRMDYSMRIWVKPDRLAQLSLMPSDVVKAIQEQNLQAPAGQVGAPPQPPSVQFQYTVRAPSRLASPEQFGDIIVKANPDGSQVRVRDLARVELGSEYYNTITRMNGRPVGLLGIYQTPGGDALKSATMVRKRLDELAKQFPADVEWSIPYDTTPPISASIEEITKTLFEAVVLVVLVVFLFLQNWRATLIPMLTVPVALIGTFALFPLFGFSINVLTMFGLVLAIGIVVDDAIVVVEAVMHHMEHGLDRRAATLKAMQEVSGPVVAIALILCAVFIPVAFMGGITGQLYKQFAVTIAVAVVLSAINALTLSPALCSTLLKPPGEGRGPLAVFFRTFNAGFDRFTGGYASITRILVRRALLSLVIMAVVIFGAVQLLKILPGGFLPQEDKGVFLVNLQLPDAASQSRTDAVMKQVEAILKSEPMVSYYTAIAGTSILTGAAASNAGSAFVSLRHWDERRAPDQQAEAIIGRVNARLAAIPEARAFAFGIPPIPGLGMAGGFTFELQDRGNGTPAQLADMARALMFEATKKPELAGVFSGYSAAVPQVAVGIDREAVRKLGVPIDSVFQALQAFLGGAYANDFNAFGRVYKVYVQAEPEFRRTPEDIRNFFVRSQSGQMVPLGTIVRVSSASGPEYIKRHNLYRAAEITGSAAPGYSSAQALGAMEDLAAKALPKSYGFEWAGQSLQEKEAEGQAGLVFGLAILFVFLLLSAQYESWSLPFSVLLGTPFALLGALLGTWLHRLDNNIYTQVGIVLLIGLAAKNAILIVEFARMKRESGVPAAEAALEAAKLRFRPILMTSFAFILGCVPLMLATGSGAASRTALGTAVVSGMTSATLIGVFLVPYLYTAVQGLSERFGGAPRPPQQRR